MEPPRLIEEHEFNPLNNDLRETQLHWDYFFINAIFHEDLTTTLDFLMELNPQQPHFVPDCFDNSPSASSQVNLLEYPDKMLFFEHTFPNHAGPVSFTASETLPSLSTGLQYSINEVEPTTFSISPVTLPPLTTPQSSSESPTHTCKWD